MVGTLRSTDAAFTSTDGREASTNFGVGYGCGRAGHPTTAHVHQYVRLGDQAWGNGNWDPSGAWDDRYPTTPAQQPHGQHRAPRQRRPHGRLRQGRRARGRHHSLDRARCPAAARRPRRAQAAGIRFRAGTETAITRELRAIPIDRAPHHRPPLHRRAAQALLLAALGGRPCGLPAGPLPRRSRASAARSGGDREQLPRAQGPEHRHRARGHLAVRDLRARTLARQHPGGPGARHALPRPAGEHGSHRRVRRREGRPSGSLDVREGGRGHHHPPGARPHAVQPGAARRCREERGRGRSRRPPTARPPRTERDT